MGMGYTAPATPASDSFLRTEHRARPGFSGPVIKRAELQKNKRLQCSRLEMTRAGVESQPDLATLRRAVAWVASLRSHAVTAFLPVPDAEEPQYLPRALHESAAQCARKAYLNTYSGMP